VDPHVNACRDSTLCFIVIVDAMVTGLMAFSIVMCSIEIAVDVGKEESEIAIVPSEHIPTSCPAGACEGYKTRGLACPIHVERQNSNGGVILATSAKCLLSSTYWRQASNVTS
jgi:hypothetical protein